MAGKNYIPELSEVRMVRRAPEAPFAFSPDDGAYVAACLKDMEAAFSLTGFPGLAFEQIPARALLKRYIDWWRGLEPRTPAQQDAHARLPAAIRLMDTISAWMEERAAPGRQDGGRR